MRLRKLARLCIHNGMGAHLFSDPSQCSCGGESDFCDHLRRCPGGEFLPEGALVIEKVDGEWPKWVYEQWSLTGLEHYAPTAFLDALASQVGESE